ERPSPRAVGAAGQEDLEGVVALDADAPGAAVAQERLHLGDPLGVGGAAQAEAFREEARPVLARAQVAALGEAGAPEVARAFLPVRVVGVPPEPRRERLLLVAARRVADDALVRLGLGRKEPLEGRAGELAGVPGMVG